MQRRGHFPQVHAVGPLLLSLPEHYLLANSWNRNGEINAPPISACTHSAAVAIIRFKRKARRVAPPHMGTMHLLSCTGVCMWPRMLDFNGKLVPLVTGIRIRARAFVSYAQWDLIFSLSQRIATSLSTFQ